MIYLGVNKRNPSTRRPSGDGSCDSPPYYLRVINVDYQYKAKYDWDIAGYLAISGDEGITEIKIKHDILWKVLSRPKLYRKFSLIYQVI